MPVTTRHAQPAPVPTPEPGVATTGVAAGDGLPISAILIRLAAIALPLMVVDQLSKLWVVRNFPVYYRNDLIDNFFAFVHWRNKGAAWGIFAEHTEWLAALSLVVLALLLLFIRQLTDGRARLQWIALGLLLGGILGNVLDRIARGSVVDFIFFFHNKWSWPAFNIADCGITIGVSLYVLSSFRHPATKSL